MKKCLSIFKFLMMALHGKQFYALTLTLNSALILKNERFVKNMAKILPHLFIWFAIIVQVKEPGLLL